jgi:hypothetical protein
MSRASRKRPARGLGRTLKNDNEVRVAMQLMLQVTENVKEAARDVKADGSPESLIKLQESIMRRDMAVEQVVGLRAEWGRTGNVFRSSLRDVKDQQGLSDFLKTKGRTPADLTDIANRSTRSTAGRRRASSTTCARRRSGTSSSSTG